MVSYANVWICADCQLVDEVQALIDLRSSLGLQYVTYPLFHPRFRRGGLSHERTGPVTRSDRLLPTKDWTSNFIAKVSAWIDADHPHSASREASQAALCEELRRSVHLSLRHVLLPAPRRDPAEYARLLLRHCDSTAMLQQQLLVTIPAVLPESAHFSASLAQDQQLAEDWDGWHLWTNLQMSIDYSTKVSIALELSEELLLHLDDDQGHEHVLLRRWAAEPVRLLLLPTRLFAFNDAGYPVLLRIWQQVVVFFALRGIGVMLTGQPLTPHTHSRTLTHGDGHDNGHSRSHTHSHGNGAADERGAGHGHGHGLLPYVQYLRHLAQRAEQSLSPLERYVRPYYDTLQIPLQPLGDDLEACTYETFEADPVKYRLYQQAIAQAMTALLQQRYDSLPPLHEQQQRIVVLVVGAGRGPLIAAALQAAAELTPQGVPLVVYAIEKNPEAVITLRNRIISERWDNVHLLQGDMRRCALPAERPHLIVSELLGSFGDNELSPECLRGVLDRYELDTSSDVPPGLCQPMISIPAQYASHLQPVTCPLLHMCARELNPSRSSIAGVGLQTPYVVYLHRFAPLSAEAALAWEFSHPSPSADDTRSAELRFIASSTGVMHGFAGYFSSVLYGDVVMSILPTTRSADMASWFPIFLPLLQPVPLTQGQEVVLRIWRCCDAHRMWYEWALTSPLRSAVHNLQGKCYHVSL